MLAKTHGEKSKRGRKAKKTPASLGMPTLTEKYNKADALVSLVYCDIANGMSRSDIIEKITNGLYKGMEKPLAARQAANYYNAGLDRFAVDCDVEAEKLRNMFYGRYETILAECMKRGDVFNARATLDSMAKIFLGDYYNKQNNIQINTNGDSKIVVTFGFNENKSEDDSEIMEAEIIE